MCVCGILVNESEISIIRMSTKNKKESIQTGYKKGVRSHVEHTETISQ